MADVADGGQVDEAKLKHMRVSWGIFANIFFYRGGGAGEGRSPPRQQDVLYTTRPSDGAGGFLYSHRKCDWASDGAIVASLAEVADGQCET